jgi:hypothetical protein
MDKAAYMVTKRDGKPDEKRAARSVRQFRVLEIRRAN